MKCNKCKKPLTEETWYKYLGKFKECVESAGPRIYPSIMLRGKKLKKIQLGLNNENSI